MSCYVCGRRGTRPLLVYENGKDEVIALHGHHRLTTLYNAGLEARLIGMAQRVSKEMFVAQRP